MNAGLRQAEMGTHCATMCVAPMRLQASSETKLLKHCWKYFVAWKVFTVCVHDINMQRYVLSTIATFYL